MSDYLSSLSNCLQDWLFCFVRCLGGLSSDLDYLLVVYTICVFMYVEFFFVYLGRNVHTFYLIMYPHDCLDILFSDSML